MNFKLKADVEFKEPVTNNGERGWGGGGYKTGGGGQVELSSYRNGCGKCFSHAEWGTNSFGVAN